jgi:hypothetical protein
MFLEEVTANAMTRNVKTVSDSDPANPRDMLSCGVIVEQ